MTSFVHQLRTLTLCLLLSAGQPLLRSATTWECARVHAQKTDTPGVVEARALANTGRGHYRAGRYQRALESYQKAAALVSRPSLTLNIGQCYRKLGHSDAALAYYRRYLAEARSQNPGTSPPFEADVRAHIETLSDAFVNGENINSVDSNENRRVENQANVVDGESAGDTPEIPMRTKSGGPGALVLIGLPPRATVIIDGRSRARRKETTRLFEMKPGQHRVRVDVRGFHSWSVNITIESGEETQKVVHLVADHPGKRPLAWFVTGAIAGSAALLSEAVAIIFVVQANKEFRGTSAFDRNKAISIAGHIGAATFALGSALSFWIYYSAPHKSTRATPHPQSRPQSSLGISPLRGGAIALGTMRF